MDYSNPLRASSRRWALFSAASAAVLVSAWGASAQSSDTTVQEVIVTAQKRPENVQSVPMSISAFSGDSLVKNNITTVADLTRFTPSVTITSSTNNRNSSIAIRNVGTSGTNPGTDQDVGVFIDGVYVQLAGPIFSELSDISTVEILRGPQGTLYGRNTPVGAVNITTKAPRSEFEASNILQLGNFERWKISGVIGGGIAENLSVRLSYWDDQSTGDIKNIYYGNMVNSDLKVGARGRLRWTPDSNTTVDLIAYYSHARTNGNNATQVDPLGPGGIVFGYSPTPTSIATSPFVIAQTAANPSHPYVVPGKWEVNSEDGASNTTNMYGVSGQIVRGLPKINATVTDILSVSSYYDHAPNQGPGGLPLDLATNEQIDSIRSTSNELRIASDKKQFIDYVAGVYYYHSNLAYNQNATSGTQGNRVFPVTTGGGGKIPYGNRSTLFYYQTIDSYAVFGQATINVTDRFRVTVGGRYSDDKKNSNITVTLSNITGAAVSPVFAAQQGGGGAIAGSREDKGKTWSLGAQYDLAKGVMAYVTSGSGFKDGGFNSRSATVQPYTFNPETSLTYEAGVKSTFFGRKLLLNADVFQMLVHRYQQSVLLPTGTGFAIGNAGNFRNQGVEVDLQAVPIAPLNITASTSYIDSKITGGADRLTCDTSYPFAGSAPPPSSGQYTDATHATCNFNGLQLSYAPKWRGSLRGKWEQPLNASMTWFVQGDASYQSSQYMDSSLDPRSYRSGYTLYGASAGLASQTGKWRLSIWGKNLSDERYFVAIAPQTQAANVGAGGTKAANGFIGWLGHPRSYGVQLDYRW